MISGSKTVKRVVIVDDSSTMRAMLDGIFAKERSLEVVGLARDVESALSLIETTRPHIVTIDLCMPYIDGSRLLALLDGHATLCKIVLSTRTNLSAAMRFKLTELGAEAIFDKKDIADDPRAFLTALLRLTEGRGARITAPAKSTTAGIVFGGDCFPTPANEAARASAVAALKIANLDFDPRLDILARHLARLAGYPVAAVNVLGSDKIWTKAAVGIGAQVSPRADSVCAHAICAEGVTAISDLRADPAYRELPGVAGSMALRSYVGAPIVSNQGLRLGMACVLDTRARIATQAEMDIVSEVALLVASALEAPGPALRRAA